MGSIKIGSTVIIFKRRKQLQTGRFASVKVEGVWNIPAKGALALRCFGMLANYMAGPGTAYADARHTGAMKSKLAVGHGLRRVPHRPGRVYIVVAMGKRKATSVGYTQAGW
jgi:hypothetical protein